MEQETKCIVDFVDRDCLRIINNYVTELRCLGDYDIAFGLHKLEVMKKENKKQEEEKRNLRLTLGGLYGLGSIVGGLTYYGLYALIIFLV